MIRTAVLAAAACLLLGVAGCGEGGGVADGAVVTAYVAAPLCAGAKRELAQQGGRAGSVRVRAVCLAGVRDRRGLSLAAIGANARRATEDSVAVGFLEAPDPPASRFSRPILESAGIAWVTESSGGAAMARLLGAIRAAGGSGSLRQAVRESLHEA
jgi:hypothetical protein